MCPAELFTQRPAPCVVEKSVLLGEGGPVGREGFLGEQAPRRGRMRGMGRDLGKKHWHTSQSCFLCPTLIRGMLGPQ